MSRTIIGICGQIGSGKSAATRHLVNSYRFKKRPFAGPIKDMMAAIGLNDDQLNGDQKEVPVPLLSGHTPRWAMQTLGTEWGRVLMNENFWVNLWLHNLPANRDVVADDVRFKNEVDIIHDNGGIVIQIERPGTGPLAHHASEQQGVRGDILISNTGTLDDLYEDIDWSLSTFWTGGREIA
jgi:hypothetical protein